MQGECCNRCYELKILNDKVQGSSQYFEPCIVQNSTCHKVHNPVNQNLMQILWFCDLCKCDSRQSVLDEMEGKLEPSILRQQESSNLGNHKWQRKTLFVPDVSHSKQNHVLIRLGASVLSVIIYSLGVGVGYAWTIKRTHLNLLFSHC